MMERRRFVKILAIGAGAATLPIRRFEAMGATEPALKPGAMITSIDNFYRVQIKSRPEENQSRPQTLDAAGHGTG